MPNTARRVGVAAVALAVTVLGVGVQLFHMPIVLSGADLNVIRGRAGDPHLLTAWIWQHAAQACGSSAACFITLNALAFAIFLLFSLVLTGAMLLRSGRSAQAFVAQACAGILIACSPFAAALIASPVGAELTASLALVTLAAVDAADLYALAPGLRCLLAAALVLQDPLLLPAALAYALTTRTSSMGWRLGATACAIVALVVRFAAENPSLAQWSSTPVDPIAGPIAVTIIGIAVFFAGPLALYGLRAYGRLGGSVSMFWRLVILSLACAAPAVLSKNGDPSPYLICAEAVLIAGLIAFARTSSQIAVPSALLASLAAIELAVLFPIHRDVPSVVIARETELLQNGVRSDAVGNFQTCIVSDASGNAHLTVPALPLAPAVRVGNIAQCPRAQLGSTRLFVASGLDLADWSIGGLALDEVARDVIRAKYVFPVFQGMTSPKTTVPSTPTRAGAFGQRVPTPTGRVGSFTVLRGFSYRFDCVPVSKGQRLTFAVAQQAGVMPQAYEVQLSAGGVNRVLSAGMDRSASRPNGAWQFVSTAIPLTSACASFIFSAPYPQADRGTWTTFAGASVD